MNRDQNHTPTEVAKKVTSIISDKLGYPLDDVKPTTKLQQDFGADSLDIVEVTMEIEKEYNISIPDVDAPGLGEDVTVQQVIELTQKHIDKTYYPTI